MHPTHKINEAYTERARSLERVRENNKNKTSWENTSHPMANYRVSAAFEKPADIDVTGEKPTTPAILFLADTLQI